MHIQIVHFLICTAAHVHTCSHADVHTFSNLGFYDRKCCLRQMCFMCQHISHRVTPKHSTSHRFICKDADPRDTFIAEMRHQYIHPSVFTSLNTVITTNSVRRQHSTAQHSTAALIIPHDHIESHLTTQTSNIPCNACIACITRPETKQIQKPTHTNTTHERAQAFVDLNSLDDKTAPLWYQNPHPTPLNPRTLELS